MSYLLSEAAVGGLSLEAMERGDLEALLNHEEFQRRCGPTLAWLQGLDLFSSLQLGVRRASAGLLGEGRAGGGGGGGVYVCPTMIVFVCVNAQPLTACPSLPCTGVPRAAAAGVLRPAAGGEPGGCVVRDRRARGADGAGGAGAKVQHGPAPHFTSCCHLSSPAFCAASCGCCPLLPLPRCAPQHAACATSNLRAPHCPFSPALRSQLPRGLTSLDMCGVAAEEADVTDRNSWPSFVPGPDPQHGWDTRLSLARLGGLKELSLRYFRWVAQGCVSWMS